MKHLLKNNRLKLNRELTSHRDRKYFSPALYAAEKSISAAISSDARGKAIDIGCGEMPYKKLCLQYVEHYDSLDIEERTKGVTYVGSVDNMHMVSDGTYDTVLCFDVLEHISNPPKALSEIHRIMKPDGTLILTVPFLARLHEEPHDYYRYTKYGLRHLIENADLQIEDIQPIAGVFSFFGHQVSTIVVCLFWNIPVIKWILFWLNSLLVVRPSVFLDRITGNGLILPLGYICIAKKNSNFT